MNFQPSAHNWTKAQWANATRPVPQYSSSWHDCGPREPANLPSDKLQPAQNMRISTIIGQTGAMLGGAVVPNERCLCLPGAATMHWPCRVPRPTPPLGGIRLPHKDWSHAPPMDG